MNEWWWCSTQCHGSREEGQTMDNDEGCCQDDKVVRRPIQ